MVMIIAPPGPTQAGWNILHITSTCNLLRFPLTECKGQMGQFETTEICLESCIRPEDNFTGRELSYHHQCWEFPLHNAWIAPLSLDFFCDISFVASKWCLTVFLISFSCVAVRWGDMKCLNLPYHLMIKKKSIRKFLYPQSDRIMQCHQ